MGLRSSCSRWLLKSCCIRWPWNRCGQWKRYRICSRRCSHLRKRIRITRKNCKKKWQPFIKIPESTHWAASWRCSSQCPSWLQYSIRYLNIRRWLALSFFGAWAHQGIVHSIAEWSIFHNAHFVRAYNVSSTKTIGAGGGWSKPYDVSVYAAVYRVHGRNISGRFRIVLGSRQYRPAVASAVDP